MLQKQIDQFNHNEIAPESLPFAVNFLKITGDSKEARALYGEMLALHGQMLDELKTDRKNGIRSLAAYCEQTAARTRFQRGVDFVQTQQSLTRPEVLVFLFMCQELAAEKNRPFGNSCYDFLGARVTADALSSDAPEAMLFKKVFLAWLSKETQPYMVQRGLEVAAQAKMKGLAPLAEKFAKDKNVNVYYRAQVLLLFPTLGANEDLKEIEPLLVDKTLIGNFNINNTRGQVQMRDVALAVCIKLSGQKMGDYDFDVMKSNDDFFQTSYIYCAFSSDEKREAAHQKYKEFQAKAAKK
jgi:hypothetical protein